MTYPNYIPFNEDTDYAAVEITVKQMYSDLNSQLGCCNSSKQGKTLCEVDAILQAMSIDSDSGDTDRYEADVQAAYLLLSPYFKLV